MSKHPALMTLLVVAGFALAVVVFQGYTIRPIDAQWQPRAAGETEFNAVAYVDGIWESRVVPTVLEKALDVSGLLSELRADRESAQARYGRQAATGGPYSFMARGEGKVTAVQSGSLLLDLPPYDGQPDIQVRIGPAFTGTALRDAVGFIDFGEFRNVLEYADVSNELNARVRNTVVHTIDRAAIAGREVAFAGAFTLQDLNQIVIVPVKLDVRG